MLFGKSPDSSTVTVFKVVTRSLSTQSQKIKMQKHLQEKILCYMFVAVAAMATEN